MQDYDGPPPYRPLIGEGAWPDHMANTFILLILLAAVIVGYLCFRAGQRMEKQRYEADYSKAPAIIFFAVRRQIDIALIATGEKAFGPIKTLLDTVDACLGPVLALSAGPNSLAGALGRLKHAMNTTKRKVSAHDDHGAGHGSAVIISSGSGSAIAAASADGGTVQVVQPARIIEVPGHGGHGLDRDVDMSSRERALAVREALEALSEYWQKERVENDLRAAQTALLISKPIGPAPLPGYTDRRPRPPRPPRELTSARKPTPKVL